MDNKLSDIELLYEDNDILVAVKPAGLAVQTKNISEKDMVSVLKNHISKSLNRPDPYLGIIHRLDKPVEGILVFALDKKAAASLSGQLNSSQFNKRYQALVEGIVDTKDEWITLSDHIVKDKDTARIVKPGDGTLSGKKAELKYKTLKIDKEEGVTLLDIELITGRFHQIRVQLSNIGHPITGDVKYGAAKRDINLQKGAIGLRAYHLSFIHPRTGERMIFEIKSETD